MNTRKPRHRTHLLATIFPVFWSIPAVQADGKPDDSDFRINDCGVNCLYVLLRSLDRDVDLAKLRASMPVPGELGLSMEQLQQAASDHGLALSGVRLASQDFPIDRPAIFLMKTGERGHYVVVQPAGTTGKMAIVLDFPRPPRLVDYDEIIAQADWTGLALIPSRPNWPARIAGGLAVVSGLALGALLVVPRLRARYRVKAA